MEHPACLLEFVFPGLEQRGDTALYRSSFLWGQKIIRSLVLHQYLPEAVSPHFCVLNISVSTDLSPAALLASSQAKELLSLSAFQVIEPAAVLTQDPSYYNTYLIRMCHFRSLIGSP